MTSSLAGAAPAGIGPDPTAALLGAEDAAAALRAARRSLDACPGGEAIALEVVDPDGRVLHRAGARAARGPEGAWSTSVDALDGVRVVARADGAEIPEALALRAEVAALAVARALLVERDRARADELSRLVSTTKQVAVSLELQPLLAAIIRDAALLLGADSGDCLLLDDESRRLRVVALYDFPPDMLGLEFDVGEGLSTQAIAARRPLIVTDYQSYEHRIRSLDPYGLKSVLCAPLVVRDRAIGALNVHGIKARREFSPHDAELLAAFADLAAIAIDHARRYENETRLGQELAAANDELRRLLSLQRRLSELVVADSGVEAIVRELAGLLERPVVLQDHLWRVVAGAAPDGVDGESWRALAIPRSTAGVGRRRTGSGDVATGNGSLEGALDGEPGDGVAAGRRVSAIRVGRETVGHLVLGAGAAAPLDRALVETAVTGLALEFAKRLAGVEVEHRLRGDVVMDLLVGSYTSEDAMIARAAHLGYDIAEPHDVLVAEIDDMAALAERHGESNAVRLKRRFLDLVHAEVVARAPGSIVSAQSDAVIVLLAVRPGSRLTPETLAVNLQQLVASALPGVTISIGIGDRATHLADYGTAFRVARESVELMRNLGRRAVVIGADQLGAFRLLLRTSAPDELRAYARRTLGPLLDPDRRGSPELLQTLRAFLEAGQSQRAAARACSVHVNTVVYRLARIQELLGVDLGDPRTVFDITLALRILDVAALEGRRGE